MPGQKYVGPFDQVILRTERWVNKARNTLQTRKSKLRHVVWEAVSRANELGALQGCQTQVVGSTSWGGDVPQSDLDVVLLTPSGDQIGRKAVDVLRELAIHLEWVLQGYEGWQIELLEACRVPVLKFADSQGLKCDITVDQHNTLWLRDHLRDALANGRPKIQRMVRVWSNCGFTAAACQQVSRGVSRQSPGR